MEKLLGETVVSLTFFEIIAQSDSTLVLSGQPKVVSSKIVVYATCSPFYILPQDSMTLKGPTDQGIIPINQLSPIAMATLRVVLVLFLMIHSPRDLFHLPKVQWYKEMICLLALLISLQFC